MGHFWFFSHHQYHIIMKFFIVALLCEHQEKWFPHVRRITCCPWIRRLRCSLRIQHPIPSTVTVGDVTLARTESSEQVFNVVQQIPHEQYSSSNQQNDIMIIVLSGT